MSWEKRVDLRMVPGFRVRGKRVVRGKALVGDDNKVAIEYDSKVHHTMDELLETLPNLRTIVTGDKELREILDACGFLSEDIDKKRASLHVTINTHLLDLVDAEAEERGVYVSKVVTDILNEHYKTNFK